MTEMTVNRLYPGLPDPDTRPDFYEGVTLKRGFAWIVDTILIALLTALAAVVLAPFTLFISLFFLPGLYAVTSFLYRWTSLARRSATPGMRFAAITFRDRFGAPLDSGSALLHTAGYTLSFMIFPLQLVSVLLMLISERGQGLTDHVLGTVALNASA